MQKVVKNIGISLVLTGLLTGCANHGEAKTSWWDGLKSSVSAPMTVLKPVRSEDHKTLRSTVHFGFDNSRIAQEDQDLLLEMINAIQKDQFKRIQVSGHTDERGSSEYNIALGWRRAQSVAYFLQANGITEDQIDLVSYGKEKPVDDRHVESAWQKNRRVELRTVS